MSNVVLHVEVVVWSSLLVWPDIDYLNTSESLTRAEISSTTNILNLQPKDVKRANNATDAERDAEVKPATSFTILIVPIFIA